MTEHFAGWLPAEGPAAGSSAGAPAAGFATGSWLPPSVARAQALDDIATAREARAEQRSREAAAEAAQDRAIAAYVHTAAVRGESVSGMDVAAGNIGRSITDVFADAIAAADHEDARQAAKAHREAGLEPEHVMIGRSDGWPESPYEADRMIARHEDNRRWLVAYRARHGYAGALEAARAKAGRGQVSRSRDGYQAVNRGLGPNVTEAPATGWDEVWRADAADGVIRRQVESAIVSVR